MDGHSPLQHHDLFGVPKPESSTDVSTGKQWKPILERGPRGPSCVSPLAEGKLQYLVVLLRWVSREGRSRAATGSGHSRLLGEAVEQHPYCQLEGSAA